MSGISHGIEYFLTSWPGMYVTQSFFHALIAAIVIDRAIRIWKISNPLIIQRLRLIVILFPIFSFPLYQAINHERGSMAFRLNALFDSSRWLQIELFGKIPLGLPFFLFLFLVAVIFFLQEMIPVVRHTLESRDDAYGDLPGGEDPFVREVLHALPGEKPPLYLLDDDDAVIFSSTGRDPAIYLSRGLIAMLNLEEMKAAVAHEMAHIERNKKPMLIVVFLLRILMFFNPVVLLEFRKAIQDEEKICDDWAVSLTRNSHALAETLRKIYREPENADPSQPAQLSRLRDSLEEHSHNIHMGSRVKRLEAGQSPTCDRGLVPFSVTLAAVAAISYFVV